MNTTRSFWGGKAFQFIPFLHSAARATKVTLTLTEQINFDNIAGNQKVSFLIEGDQSALNSFLDLYDTTFTFWIAVTS